MISYSIIICTYNRVTYLVETIEAVLLHFKDKKNFELLIIDNNSTDDTADRMKAYSHLHNVTYHLETSQGLSHARNRGIKEAHNDILIFWDDDIDVEGNYLDHCDTLFSDPKISIVGGKVLPYRSKVPDWLPLKYYFLVSIFDIGDEPRFVNKLMGANYGMRKEVAHEVGSYNTALGRKGKSLMGGEENDYFERAQKLGFTVFYSPQLIVYHKIQEKLTEAYIYDYAYKNGVSQALIDKQQSLQLIMLKSFKNIFRILAFYFFGRFYPAPKQNRYKIRKLSATGYLDGAFKSHASEQA